MENIKRICATCKEEKDLDDFVADKRKIHGKAYQCKSCHKERYKKWRQENWEEILERYRERYKENSKEILEKKKKHKKCKHNPAKTRTRHITKYAIKLGHLIRKPCEVCDNPRSHAHHMDYNDPFNIKWLCALHHAEWHRYNKAIEPRDALRDALRDAQRLLLGEDNENDVCS